MHFSSLAILSCVASSSVLASPQASPILTATVQLVNRNSGASVNVVIPMNGVEYDVQTLWKNTAVDNAPDGTVFASNAQLVAFKQNTICTFTEQSIVKGKPLDAQTTWIEFASKPVDMCGSKLTCKST
ncbi:hypothetical protein N7495_007205 [Penicillium taxi]|uniref:uncharacterized protein n=1 Tax=Penicillium taxi TaxID=168475 RepID=UPI00254525F5|nr:uncharacterized protein N7495_007205 [Penicillium taxi]KAJ5895514.1 hypothetical protein N7495_007205 [Penicillium taxi]